jgi:hypothetical protein
MGILIRIERDRRYCNGLAASSGPDYTAWIKKIPRRTALFPLPGIFLEFV